jgi:glycosyltransferase involved in cell wall biosynthesis
MNFLILSLSFALFFHFCYTKSMISVVILTKNNQETIERTLESVRSFPEVLLFDTGSSDDTLKIASQHANVHIKTTVFSSFGALRNEAASLASHDWILALDSDEELSDALVREIQKTPLDEETIYSFPRHNFYNGKAILFCGWHPEQVARLYHRKKSHFDQAYVHESLVLDGKKIHLFSSPIFHTPYRSLEDFLSKMQLYSSLFAEQHQAKKKSSLTIAIVHALAAFFKSYFLKKGLFGGAEGFIISMYNSQTAFYKYLKLWERNKKLM